MPQAAREARIVAEVQPGRRYSFMEFCGGHTHAISRYGIAELIERDVWPCQPLSLAEAEPAPRAGRWLPGVSCWGAA